MGGQPTPDSASLRIEARSRLLRRHGGGERRSLPLALAHVVSTVRKTVSSKW